MLLSEIYAEPRLKDADDAFAAWLKSGGRPGRMPTIESVVKDVFNMDAEVEAVRNDAPFFGMKVYPSAEEAVGLGLAVSRGENGEKFRRCTGVAIQVDGQIPGHDFTAREMTAMLLHEVGHKLRYKESVEIALASLFGHMGAVGVGITAIIAIPGAGGVIAGVIAALLGTSFVDVLKGTAEEIKADEVAVRYGYAPELHSAVSRVAAMPAAARASGDPEAVRKAAWTADAITMLHSRRMAVLGQLQSERRRAKTDWEKELIDRQINIIRRNYMPAWGN